MPLTAAATGTDDPCEIRGVAVAGDGATPRSGRTRWGLVVAAGAVALVLECVAVGWGTPRTWLPDLLVGLALLVGSALAWPRERSVAVLLAVAGACWFAGTALPAAAFLHVGPLLHVLITVPVWRPRTRLEGAAASAGWLVAVAMPSWQSDAGVAGVAVGLLVVLVARRSSASAPRRRARRLALRLGAVLSAAMLVGAALRAFGGGPDAAELALSLHQVAVVVVGLGLAAGAARPAHDGVTDLVVELHEAGPGAWRAALARALGDPGLQVGHVTDDGTYVDEGGRALALPSSGGSTTATFVERDGRPFAALLHDGATLADAALAEAVATATRLGDSNGALRREVGARMAEIDASRRRLLQAADVERAQLAQRLHDGVDRHLALLHARLARVAGPAADEGVARVLRELSHCRADLSALARGLRPQELDDGLAAAVRSLAGRTPVPVDVSVPEERFDPEVETAAWFVCSEAVANAVKHSGATRLTVTVARAGPRLVVAVGDEGSGGADLSAGTGLRGLADRVETLHGRLDVLSPPGGGTVVRAELPLDGARG